MLCRQFPETHVRWAPTSGDNCIDAKHAIAHHKIMTIDRETGLTGGFNFTKGADEKNAENLLVLHSKDLAKAYLNRLATTTRRTFRPLQGALTLSSQIRD
jgi:phosphatidylserine/phosphatidylglycerophosphate/cardiolipin synthase-like enzyme